MSTAHHLIVVDDDKDMRDLIIAYFRPRGFQVSEFADAESALAESQTRGAFWDVILCDLKLPQMSGVDLTVRMKKTFPRIPVILITNSNSAEVAVDAVKQGAYDFIVKPVHFPQLQISVERALHIRALSQDLHELRERVKTGSSLQRNIVGKSPRFLEALDVARRVAKSKANIFISGESGTGKEVFANFIHSESPRAKGPFVAINCSAIPEYLLESELFGHAKGAFTGAHEKKIGLFEEAQEGTLFLDEIGDLSLPLQGKLLRVFQERKIKRVGENQLRPINCRVISATHKDLIREIKENHFREDLFFRLNVIPIFIPPLRERPEDLLPLADTFLRKFALENDSPARTFSKEVVRYILENKWRGNVRELENAIERAVVLTNEAEIPLKNFLPLDTGSEPQSFAPALSSRDQFTVKCECGLPLFDDVMNQYIEFAVEKNGGVPKLFEEIALASFTVRRSDNGPSYVKIVFERYGEKVYTSILE